MSAINKAVRDTRKQNPQAFLVGSFWSENDRSGIVLINTQSDHDRYIVWNIGATGARYSGFYTSDYHTAMNSYNDRLIRLMKRDGFVA